MFTLPFWQEFGIIVLGTLALFFALVKLERKIRKHGGMNDEHKQ